MGTWRVHVSASGEAQSPLSSLFLFLCLSSSCSVSPSPSTSSRTPIGSPCVLFVFGMDGLSHGLVRRRYLLTWQAYDSHVARAHRVPLRRSRAQRRMSAWPTWPLLDGAAPVLRFAQRLQTTSASGSRPPSHPPHHTTQDLCTVRVGFRKAHRMICGFWCVTILFDLTYDYSQVITKISLALVL